jgi:transmembrane sensor
MSQYDFDELLQKYLAGNCDPAEEKLILDWYQDMIVPSPEPVDAQTKEVIRKRVWKKLSANTIDRLKTKPRHWLSQHWMAMAACVALLIVAGIWLTYSFRTQTGTIAHLNGSIEIKNTSHKSQIIKLEDGTVISLKPTGILSYPEHFGDKNRTVYLKGEAFFQVKKNPAKPFIVHTGELVTEVLGTSFTIKSYEGAKDIEVAVTTGRVSVYQATENPSVTRKEVILKPNERITYNTQSKELIPTLVEAPLKVMPPSQPESFVFNGTPLPDVLARLQSVYGIDIFTESDAMNSCVLNADLNELPMYSQLELICKSINATYEIRGTSIFIKGKGCQYE